MQGLRVVRVRGRSMQPTLHDGDLLLVLTDALPRPGGLGIVQLPPEADGTPRPLAVKRVTGRDPTDPQRLWVESDNRLEGTDSWTFGSVAASDVRGRVVARLRWPWPQKRGRSTGRPRPPGSPSPGAGS